MSSPGEYAQDIFTVRASYFGGRPPKSVNMFWRRFAVSSIPLDNPKEFDLWLRARWVEKDRLLEYYHRHNRFPADEGVERLGNGKTRRGAGFIETEIKPNYWFEFMQVFAPMGLFALVLYVFYGALPESFTKSIDKKTVLDLASSVGSNPAVKSKAQGSGTRMVDLETPGRVHEMPVHNRTNQKPPHGNAQGRNAGNKTTQGMKAPTAQMSAQKKPFKTKSTQKTSTKGTAPQQSRANGVATKQQAPPLRADDGETNQKPVTKPKKLELKSHKNPSPAKLEVKSKPQQAPKKLPIHKPELKPDAKSTPRKLDVRHDTQSAASQDDSKHEKALAPEYLEKKSAAASNVSKKPKKLEIRPSNKG